MANLEVYYEDPDQRGQHMSHAVKESVELAQYGELLKNHCRVYENGNHCNVHKNSGQSDRTYELLLSKECDDVIVTPLNIPDKSVVPGGLEFLSNGFDGTKRDISVALDVGEVRVTIENQTYLFHTYAHFEDF